MSDNFHKASLLPRVLSAAVALVLITLIGWRYQAFGIQIVVAITMLLAVREFVRMGFDVSNRAIGWFWLNALTYGISLFLFEDPFLVSAIDFVIFLAGGLWLARNRLPNDRLLSLLTLGLFGLCLCIALPSFTIATLRLPNGLHWFTFHLAVVFMGDIAAYFGGIRLGETKLMPEVSPKKTVVGAYCGLAGSTLAGMGLMLAWFPSQSLLLFAVFSLVCGTIAQSGDLLISLVKRVAQVKDSGQLMPGHGGVLDRLDGILFTCPLVYALANAVETWL